MAKAKKDITAILVLIDQEDATEYSEGVKILSSHLKDAAYKEMGMVYCNTILSDKYLNPKTPRQQQGLVEGVRKSQYDFSRKNINVIQDRMLELLHKSKIPEVTGQASLSLLGRMRHIPETKHEKILSIVGATYEYDEVSYPDICTEVARNGKERKALLKRVDEALENSLGYDKRIDALHAEQKAFRKTKKFKKLFPTYR